jgi:nicotinamidase-related amidase
MQDREANISAAVLPPHDFHLDPARLGNMNRIEWQKYVHAESTAMLMVDLQNDSLPPEDSPAYVFGATPMWKALNGLRNLTQLVGAARKHGIRVFWVKGGFDGVGQDLPADGIQGEFVRKLQEQFPGALSRGNWEFQIADEIRHLVDPQDIVICKRFSSSFVGTNLPYLLSEWGIRTVIVCGVFTDYCVESAVRNSSDLGYYTLLVADASFSTSWEDQYHTCYHLSNIFATITTTDEIVNVIETNASL